MRPLVLWLIPLTGCADAAMKQGCAAAALVVPDLAIGVVAEAMEPSDDGASAPIVAGPQGGWHVFGSLWATGLWVGDEARFDADTLPTITFEVLGSAGEVLGGYREVPTRLRALPSGRAELVDSLLVLRAPDPTALDGESARVEATASDVCGTTVSAAIDVVLQVLDDN